MTDYSFEREGKRAEEEGGWGSPGDGCPYEHKQQTQTGTQLQTQTTRNRPCCCNCWYMGRDERGGRGDQDKRWQGMSSFVTEPGEYIVHGLGGGGEGRVGSRLSYAALRTADSVHFTRPIHGLEEGELELGMAGGKPLCEWKDGRMDMHAVGAKQSGATQDEV
ncbi:hypothetical protein GY45DRAFT_1149486 [Cubamyces sp. BRFM 1775]|nr:hypothetical protein GY45DRAFT_1149486 [Cubamyces sp. BRFM 1775]